MQAYFQIKKRMQQLLFKVINYSYYDLLVMFIDRLFFHTILKIKRHQKHCFINYYYSKQTITERIIYFDCTNQYNFLYNSDKYL